MTFSAANVHGAHPTPFSPTNGPTMTAPAPSWTTKSSSIAVHDPIVSPPPRSTSDSVAPWTSPDEVQLQQRAGALRWLSRPMTAESGQIHPNLLISRGEHWTPRIDANSDNITVLFGLQIVPGSPASAVSVLEPLVVPQGAEPQALSDWLATSVCDVSDKVGRLMWMLSQVPDHLSRVVQSVGAVPVIVKEPEWVSDVMHAIGPTAPVLPSPATTAPATPPQSSPPGDRDPGRRASDAPTRPADAVPLLSPRECNRSRTISRALFPTRRSTRSQSPSRSYRPSSLRGGRSRSPRAARTRGGGDDAVVISTKPPIAAGKPSSRARQYLTEMRVVAMGPAAAIRNMVDPMWVHRFIARYSPRYFVMDEKARVIRMWMREDDGVSGIELESGIVMGHVRLHFELVHRPDARLVPHPAVPAVPTEPVSIYLIFFRDVPGNAVRDLARKLDLLDINGFVDIPSSKHMAVTPRCWYAFMSVFASSHTRGEALDGTVFRGHRLRVVRLYDAARLFAAGDDRELKKAIESHAWTW
ncbi:hypothetical protein AMAG_08013 [Allomyces macrogynus ATCC 38327]|uniref:Uncharacterized protein n=1 Tax=Allomyces macrogynus (strain ATCC 38327) TaxID=578462 RepID=A0A0L0SK88_ALLM3|nr:hypothetical protein AMAG_08013 [Allomyces macrogynus ATCC 38327]|eukprot:KNE62834.1 hypothetical protein AMAG_08013 [Allomyces macrogynus ATCC 38327]